MAKTFNLAGIIGHPSANINSSGLRTTAAQLPTAGWEQLPTLNVLPSANKTHPTCTNYIVEKSLNKN